MNLNTMQMLGLAALAPTYNWRINIISKMALSPHK